MDFEKMWKALKYDMETAVLMGMELNCHTEPETSDGGRFDAYNYTLKKMIELERTNL